MKLIIAAGLIGAASVATAQDISSIKLCSFDFNVTSSKIGFPDKASEISPGVSEWKYPGGRVLVFQHRHLLRVAEEGVPTRAVAECTESQIAEAAKDMPPPVPTKDLTPPAAVKAKVAAERSAPRVKAKSGVRIGMTVKQVLNSSWGRPEDINRTTNRYGTREQWVYGGGNYLYFENGMLTSIQN